MKTLKDFKEDFILFLEVGFIAVGQSDETSSLSLFKCCELLDPQNLLSKVGKGYLHINKLELKEAIQDFEAVLKQDEKNEMAKTFMGLSYSLMPNGTDKGYQILLEMTKSKDEAIKKLAQTSLDFVDRFIKKHPGPAEVQK